jgi:hypothetical protein
MGYQLMSKITRPIFSDTNCETGEVTQRQMSDDEFSAYCDFLNRIKAEEEEAAKKATDKAALLAQLGITEEQAKLLLG